MRGVYRFYQGGELIGESENIITTAGKTIIMQYLAGYIGKFADSMAVGLFNTAAAATDTLLYAEWERTPVLTVTPDYANTLLVFKGRLPEASSGWIYEAGLFSPNNIDNEYSSRVLVEFDSTKETWSAGTFTTGNVRLGADTLRMNPGASATLVANLSNIFLDLSGYSDVDEFRVAYNVANTNSTNVSVRFYTDASNYYSATVATNPTTGYKVTTVAKSAFAATGTPSWANITMVGISVTSGAGGTSQIDFDMIRVDDKDSLSDNNVLISRTVPTPVAKTAGLPLDIEYSLDITL